MLLVVGLSTATLANAQATDSPAERGRAIYFGEDGNDLEQTTASIGGMDVALPAQSFPCVSCHGELGVARVERGVTPPDISRQSLMRPYRSGSGRTTRPAYSLELFGRAIREGIDPAGVELASSMPRFDLDDEQVAALWLFLDDLKTLQTPGVTDTSILIGGYLPEAALSTGERDALRNTWAGLFESVNASGGIFGRRLEFRAVQDPGAEAGDLFALLVPAILAAEEPVSLPIIGGAGTVGLGSDSFRLLAGTEEQAAALEIFAAAELGLVKLLEVECDGDVTGGTAILRRPECAAQAGDADTLLVPLSVFVESAPHLRSAWPAETYVAVPQSIDHITPQSRDTFSRLRMMTGSSPEHMVLQADAYSSAVVAIEALVRSGRSLTRRKFVTALEGFRDFEGAMTPPLTFSPNRRTGSTGVNIVRYDSRSGMLANTGTWVDPKGS